MAKTTATREEIGSECGQAWETLVEANVALRAVLDDVGLYQIILGVVQKRAKRYLKSLEKWLEAIEEGEAS